MLRVYAHITSTKAILAPKFQQRKDAHTSAVGQARTILRSPAMNQEGWIRGGGGEHFRHQVMRNVTQQPHLPAGQSRRRGANVGRPYVSYTTQWAAVDVQALQRALRYNVVNRLAGRR
jgi:hypothetical protein